MGGMIERCECGVSSSTAHLPKAPRFIVHARGIYRFLANCSSKVSRVCVASVEIQALEMYGIILSDANVSFKQHSLSPIPANLAVSKIRWQHVPPLALHCDKSG